MSGSALSTEFIVGKKPGIGTSGPIIFRYYLCEKQAGLKPEMPPGTPLESPLEIAVEREFWWITGLA